MKKIMIAVDFSDVTGMLVDEGIEYAKTFGAKVQLVHTEPPETGFVLFGYGMPPSIAGYYVGMPAENDKRHNEIIKDAQHSLDILKMQFSEQKIEAETILLEGNTADELIKLADSTDTDLLIIGNHKHGRFYNFIFNDIGQNIIAQSNCNVLVVETQNI